MEYQTYASFVSSEVGIKICSIFGKLSQLGIKRGGRVLILRLEIGSVNGTGGSSHPYPTIEPNSGGKKIEKIRAKFPKGQGGGWVVAYLVKIVKFE